METYFGCPVVDLLRVHPPHRPEAWYVICVDNFKPVVRRYLGPYMNLSFLFKVKYSHDVRVSNSVEFQYDF